MQAVRIAFMTNIFEMLLGGVEESSMNGWTKSGDNLVVN